VNKLINKVNCPYIVIEGISDSSISMELQTCEKIQKNTEFRCIYAGRLDSVFGIKSLIEGFLEANIPLSKLVIYGHGDMVPYVRNKCAESSKIIYNGVVENREVLCDELNSTLLINPRPTIYEYTKYSFPSKNIEYMSTGTPVLTTKLQGMPSSYYDHVYFIEDESAKGISESLLKVYNEPSENLFEKGRSAKQFILQETNENKQGEKLYKLIIQMLNRGSNNEN